jgi:YHS domain-containing protein
MPRAVQALLIAMSLLTAACAPFVTQSPGAGYSPVNAVKEDGDSRVLLKGADVVAYFTDHAYRQGSPAIKSVYKEVTFYFVSPEHKTMFDASPGKYLPQFGGYCTNGIVYGIPWGGDADVYEMLDGKLYMFGGRGSHDAFMLDVPRNMALANKYWDEEVNGSNAFWQRTKRLVFRVPHYKSGEELAKEVAAAKAAGKLK